jgi:hypothetical protein
MGYSFGQPPSGINGAGPIVGPPASSRSGLGCGVGERVGTGVGNGLAVAVALAVGEVPAVGEAVPAAESAALAQLSTVTVYGLSRPVPLLGDRLPDRILAVGHGGTFEGCRLV